MKDILLKCYQQSCDCLIVYDASYNDNRIANKQNLHNVMDCKNRQDVINMLQLMKLDASALVMNSDPNLELLHIKAGIILTILENKALTHGKFCKLVPKIKLLFKPIYTDESMIYSILKMLNPKWEVK